VPCYLLCIAYFIRIFYKKNLTAPRGAWQFAPAPHPRHCLQRTTAVCLEILCSNQVVLCTDHPRSNRQRSMTSGISTRHCVAVWKFHRRRSQAFGPSSPLYRCRLTVTSCLTVSRPACYLPCPTIDWRHPSRGLARYSTFSH